jgi:hypothetical protein
MKSFILIQVPGIAENTDEFRIPRSDAFFSQPATDPIENNQNNDDCTGIGCWLTEKRLGSRNSEFFFEIQMAKMHRNSRKSRYFSTLLNIARNKAHMF